MPDFRLLQLPDTKYHLLIMVGDDRSIVGEWYAFRNFFVYLHPILNTKQNEDFGTDVGHVA